jgi:hypothetical protein
MTHQNVLTHRGAGCGTVIGHLAAVQPQQCCNVHQVIIVHLKSMTMGHGVGGALKLEADVAWGMVATTIDFSVLGEACLLLSAETVQQAVQYAAVILWHGLLAELRNLTDGRPRWLVISQGGLNCAKC